MRNTAALMTGLLIAVMSAPCRAEEAGQKPKPDPAPLSVTAPDERETRVAPTPRSELARLPVIRDATPPEKLRIYPAF